MNKPIIIYGKQPVIIHTTDLGELIVHETESHNKKDLAKTFANLLRSKVLSKDISLLKNIGSVIYNEGCRVLEFKLGFIQK